MQRSSQPQEESKYHNGVEIKSPGRDYKFATASKNRHSEQRLDLEFEMHMQSNAVHKEVFQSGEHHVALNPKQAKDFQKQIRDCER